MHHSTWPHRLLVTLLGLAAILALGGCGTAYGRLDRAAADATTYTDSQLLRMLLPRAAVPARLRREEEHLLPNETAAAYFGDVEAALHAMAEVERVQGAAVEYRLPAQPTSSEPVIAVSSTVSWYRRDSGAQAVMQQGMVEPLIPLLRLHAGEIRLETVAEESRAFRGYREGEAADHVAYLIVFRRANLIGCVVVIEPARNDDGGRLAVKLARRQAERLGRR
jgi:hypothetical protein